MRRVFPWFLIMASSRFISMWDLKVFLIPTTQKLEVFLDRLTIKSLPDNNCPRLFSCVEFIYVIYQIDLLVVSPEESSSSFNLRSNVRAGFSAVWARSKSQATSIQRSGNLIILYSYHSSISENPNTHRSSRPKCLLARILENHN